MVALSLMGIGMFSGVSIFFMTGVEAQGRESRLERWTQWSAKKERAVRGESAEATVDQSGPTARMNIGAVPRDKRMATVPPAMPEAWAESLTHVVPSQLEPVSEPSTVTKPGDGRSSLSGEASGAEALGVKTIAIDAELDDGGTPAVTNVDDMVQFAAQMWSNASFPVEQFQAYTSPFGYRSSPTGGYRQEFHYGLDIAAPQQSYIRNWWAGTVIEVSDGGSCGTSIVIQSGEWTHMYCHMQGHVEVSGGVPSLIDRDGGIQIWEGQQIIAGDRIGRVGMTGRTTGPHLHWGLKYQNNWVDPAWVLQAMAASYQALYGQN